MINIKLKKLMETQGVTGRQLSKELDLRPNTISEILNNQRTSINKEHLTKIMKYFNIKDFNEILELVDED